MKVESSTSPFATNAGFGTVGRSWFADPPSVLIPYLQRSAKVGRRRPLFGTADPAPLGTNTISATVGEGRPSTPFSVSLTLPPLIV